MKKRPTSPTSPRSDSKRSLTFRYLLFFALFWPQSYRILIGLVAALIIAPLLFSPEMGIPGRVVLFGMIATIGFAMSAGPGRAIAEFFRKRILR